MGVWKSRSMPCVQIVVQRYDGHPSTKAAAAQAEGAAEVSLWAPGERGAAARMHPLSMYEIRTSGAIGKGKGLVDPDHMAGYEARSLRFKKPDSANYPRPRSALEWYKA